MRSPKARAFFSSDEYASQSGRSSAVRKTGMAAFIAASQHRAKSDMISGLIRVREASIAVNQARKFTMDAKREASMASTVVASQPRKTTIKEASVAVSQARK